MNYYFLTLRKKNVSLFYLVIISGLFLLAPVVSPAQDLDVPYVPTPPNVVEQMLDLADVQPSDYVIDLGSGDGRIVIAAAKRGASGHGIDLDPKRIAEARDNASKAGVSDRVMFMEQNIFDTDFSAASVITMYLLPSVNIKLRPELLSKLAPGTKIISHSFDMDEWNPDKQLSVDSPDGMQSHDIYYWVVPAKVNGNWGWTTNGSRFSMQVNQKFQEISVSLTNGNGISYDIQKAQLQGNRISLQAVNGNQNYIFSGQIEGDTIKGIVQLHDGDKNTVSPWTAGKSVANSMK